MQARTKGMFRRSFFLLRLVDVKGVRVTECDGRGYQDAVGVGASGCGALKRGDVGESEQTREGTLRRILQVELEGVAGGGYWRCEGPKGVFGRVLEFGGRGASRRVQIVKCGEARRDEIIDVRDGTGGSGGPRDTYARWGVVPSVGIVISVKRVVEFKGRGHCMPRSDMMETVQM